MKSMGQIAEKVKELEKKEKELRVRHGILEREHDIVGQQQGEEENGTDDTR